MQGWLDFVLVLVLKRCMKAQGTGKAKPTQGKNDMGNPIKDLPPETDQPIEQLVQQQAPNHFTNRQVSLGLNGCWL